MTLGRTDTRVPGDDAPPIATDEEARGTALILALYTLADINAEIHDWQPAARRELTEPDDVGLVDDVVDALLDPAQSAIARPVLRKALAQIARDTLLARDR